MQSEPLDARTQVWALPVSLAATPGIDVSYSSSPYLDVSVQEVPLHTLCIGVWIPLMWWVSPFRYLRINGYLLLPEAFRSLSRLSSALSAKASTLRSSSFDLSHTHAFAYGSLRYFHISQFNVFTLYFDSLPYKDNSSDVSFFPI